MNVNGLNTGGNVRTGTLISLAEFLSYSKILIIFFILIVSYYNIYSVILKLRFLLIYV